MRRARAIAEGLAATAAQRDAEGGTPLAEREQLRQSGLLVLVIPREQGGEGGSWPEALRAVRAVAEADASLAHVLGYHYLGVATPHLFGSRRQRERAYADTVQGNFFWGNAVNPLDMRTTLHRDASGWRLDGDKSFCSGSADSGRLVVSASRPDGTGVAVLVLPTTRPGVKLLGDWDNMGQRQTDSGTVQFTAVQVEEGEVLGPPGPGGSPFATLRACMTQIILCNIFAGIARGAIGQAASYTRAQARPWPGSGVESATHDPYVLHTYGELEVDIQAAECLIERAGELLQEAWVKDQALTDEERGRVAVAAAIARASAARASLTTANRMFEVMGARATGARQGFDRFWRNARTLTLHDPLDYKLREVGDWALNGMVPTPGFYS